LLATADQVVSNDSGLMHIAAALQRPLVVIYGPTSPAFTPPLSDNARIEQIDVECGPCFQRTCPEGHHRCMRDIRLSAVLEHIASNNNK
jgi:heptosyltransferase-2